MKRKQLYYLSPLIALITLVQVIVFTIDSHALTFFNTESDFLSSAPAANTETFNGYAAGTDGILPFTFSGTLFDDDKADSRMWRISPLESLGWGDSYSYDLNALLSTSVQDDYFSFFSKWELGSLT